MSTAMEPSVQSKAVTQANLGPLDQVPQGEGRTFQVGSLRLAVFRTRQGAVFACQAECPHRSGPLADGVTGGGSVVCPMHGWKFDLATGETANGECGLTTYPASISASGEIVVTLPCD
ncbi:MAG TPA: Rieske 2Fe-2S domain-containing protein [Chthonomonadaceae bacterium]|nr:Rieske 2Fe-2S domain-containing protein [Chthonomonadaceae bacterium]